MHSAGSWGRGGAEDGGIRGRVGGVVQSFSALSLWNPGVSPSQLSQLEALPSFGVQRFLMGQHIDREGALLLDIIF